MLCDDIFGLIYKIVAVFSPIFGKKYDIDCQMWDELTKEEKRNGRVEEN